MINEMQNFKQGMVRANSLIAARTVYQGRGISLSKTCQPHAVIADVSASLTSLRVRDEGAPR
jgi:hypothetical protein